MQCENAKVLVIDDDALMRKFICITLNRLPVQSIREATGGADGLSAVTEFQPDIILSDVHMASMSGLEFVRQLRLIADPQLRRIPVLMLSADEKEDTFQQAVPLGIFAHLTKPPKLEALRVQINRALKFRH